MEIIRFLVIALAACSASAASSIIMVPQENVANKTYESPKTAAAYLPGVPFEISMNRPTTQSSTNRDSCNPISAKATDGNTEGVYSWCTVTQTKSEANPWWQVDLGASSVVAFVKLFNRIDCCMERLDNFSVILLSEKGAVLKSVKGRSGVIQEVFNVPIFPVVDNVRYVKIQRNVTGVLSLAEVKVFGSNSLGSPRNLARHQPTQQSSTYPSACEAVSFKAVDGITEGVFSPWCSVTHTNNEAQPWWKVDLGSVKQIDKVFVYNRVDCCMIRLINFYVEIFDQTNKLVHQSFVAGYGKIQVYRVCDVPNGRFVRIRLDGRNVLSLAEVQVWGTDAAESIENIAKDKYATQSSTGDSDLAECAPTAAKAVDGSTHEQPSKCSIAETQYADRSWWEVDLGATRNISIVNVFKSASGGVGKSEISLLDNKRQVVKAAPVKDGGNEDNFYEFHGIPAQYVRVQTIEKGVVSLAEVEVYE